MLSSVQTLTILGLDSDGICSDLESPRDVCLPLGQDFTFHEAIIESAFLMIL